MLHHGKPKIWGVSPLGERGQIVIPSKLREELNLEKGENFVFVTRGKFIGMVNEKDMTGFLRGMLDRIEDLKTE